MLQLEPDFDARLRHGELNVPGLATPVSVPRGLSAAASFCGILAVAVLFFGTGPNGKDGSRPARAEAPRIDVVFRDDLTAGAMASAIEDLDGEVVAGPSARGRWRIELPPDADPEVAAQQLSDSGLAIYAEPALD